MKTRVIVRLQFEATHNWPGCPFPEVAYLKDEHRHVFHIEAKKAVTHDDRDVEIIMLKKTISNYLGQEFSYRSSSTPRMGHTSCEMLARKLLEKFDLEYCSVLEDNENGAEIFKEQRDV